jgi:hypothetical protein
MESKLKAFFPEEDLEWRVQSCGLKNETPWAMVLCYVQARAIQKRLDEVVGWGNWKDEYRVEGKNIICRLSVKIGSEWVAKENGASETDIEAFKGGISGAFKRVASSGFGIGRYLYDLDSTFAVCSLEKKKGYTGARTKEGKYIYWETPKMPKQFLPPEPLLFDKIKKALQNAKDEATFDKLYGEAKKRKKELNEADWAEIEKIAGEEKGKHVRLEK